MPTDTFDHLPADKRERIFQAAVKEFGRSRFSEASINRIVKDAGIPRGSFYQYFTGKEDIYLYVLQEISREKLEIFASSGSGPNAASVSGDAGAAEGEAESGFFSLLNQALPRIFAWANQRADYNQIGLRMAQDDSEFIRGIYGKMTVPSEVVRGLIERDQARGLIRRDVNPALLLDLFRMLAESLLREYYHSADRAGVVEKIKAIFQMLYMGLRGEKNAYDGGGDSGTD
jgi:AcrR family transcriptional regulator